MLVQRRLGGVQAEPQLWIRRHTTTHGIQRAPAASVSLYTLRDMIHTQLLAQQLRLRRQLLRMRLQSVSRAPVVSLRERLYLTGVRDSPAPGIGRCRTVFPRT